MIEDALARVKCGHDLSDQEVQTLIDGMLRGAIADDSIGKLLLALRDKGESVSELVGAARALRSHMVPIRTKRVGLLDTCGTGGDGAKTFNISTAAALIAAAAGVPVAKHGNRKISSVTGSADVLEQLGIRIDSPREIVEDCLDELGIGFCFAPLLHPAMKHVAQVRRGLGVPTLFNYLGPLCNPASASYQILGVGKAGLQEKIAEALSQLGIVRGIVVRGVDGLDEVTLADETIVLEVLPGRVQLLRWKPKDFGFEQIDPSELAANGPEESADIIRGILRGHRGAPRNVAVANAAAGLWVARQAVDLKEAVLKCESAIDSGKAHQLVSDLAQRSQQTQSFGTP